MGGDKKMQWCHYDIIVLVTTSRQQLFLIMVDLRFVDRAMHMHGVFDVKK